MSSSARFPSEYGAGSSPRRRGSSGARSTGPGRGNLKPVPSAPHGGRPGAAPSAAAYVLSASDVSPGWVMLYAATFALALVCATVRGIVAYPVVWLGCVLVGLSTGYVGDLTWAAAYGPLVLSAATLVLPLSGWWWQQSAGGRSPSERERLIYDDAMDQLARRDPGLRRPRRWCVLDGPETNAAVFGDTLMITRGLLETPYLTAVLAHELGHLNSSDARLKAALRRLTTPPRGRLAWPLRTVASPATGEAALWVMRLPWAAYWRAREFEADRYAAKLGEALPLSTFLDTQALVHDLPIPFPWMHEHSHPPTEHRIDRIERGQEAA
jgi:Zn-dependent protease with chaperone function